MTQPQTVEDIAIIGMSALFAKAGNLPQYWQNICNQVDGVSEATPEWIRNTYDPLSSENDRLCTQKGGFLHDLAQFQPLEFGIMPRAVDGGGPDQYLAVQAVKRALVDAGYDQRPFNSERTGVILGYGSYMNRGFANLLQHGLVVDQTLDLLRQIAPQLETATLTQIREGLKASLPPFTPEMCPGLVPNNVSGRVANRLNLMGPNYVVDAACASSLISVHLGMEELRHQRCDMVIVGGVNASAPAPISLIFNQLGALTRNQIRPFDATASGTLLGEGLGILVLKRLSDAEADQDRIYAVLKSVGSASDGKALSSVAPRLEGELLAIQRAYADAAIDPATIGLVEAHGTSIPLGDRTEVAALTQAFGERRGKLPHCALGSVKSMVAHCTTAAGAAGLIKTALALHHKVLPPTLCDQVNPDLNIEATPFYINNQTRPWIHGHRDFPRRAAVNAFGFGGINTHAILEEYRQSPAPSSHTLSMVWPSELIVITAPSRSVLISKIVRVQRYLQQVKTPNLANLAYTLSQQVTQRVTQPMNQQDQPQESEESCRLALVVSDGETLTQQLTKVVEKLTTADQSSLDLSFKLRSGVFYQESTAQGLIAFLFPGEGAQYTNMLLDLCLYFPAVRQWFDLLDEAFIGSEQPLPSQVIFPAPTSLTPTTRQWVEEQLMGMDLGPAAVFVACMALYELLRSLGVRGDLMVGHSSGENAALTASETVVYEQKSQLIDKMGQFNQIIQAMEQQDLVPHGMLLAVGGISTERIQQIVGEWGDHVQIAMDNCTNQVILFGKSAVMKVLHERLKAEGGMCLILPFDRAYHTPLFAEAGQALRRFYDTFTFQVGHTPVYSCATCDRFPDDPVASRDLAAYQWAAPVRFRELIQQLYDQGCRTFLEIGPSSNLTAFVTDILRGQNACAIATNSRQKPGLEQLQLALAQLFTQGMDLEWPAYFCDRSLETLDLDLTDLDLTDLDLTDLNSEKTTGQPLAPPFPFPTTLPVAQLPTALAQQVRAALQSGQPAYGTVAGLDQGVSPAVSSTLRAPSIVASDVELWPFLGEILEQSPTQLVCERKFTLADDLFLQDHVFGGALSQYQPDLKALPVIPLTFSLEMLAEAANALVGPTKQVVSLHGLRAYRWLALDRSEITLQAQATLQTPVTEMLTAEEISVLVKILQGVSQADPQKVVVFEGEVRLRTTALLPPLPLAFSLIDPHPASLADADLYQTCMFHGPQLQGVRHLRRWAINGLEADLVILPTQGFFSHGRRPQFCLDPGLLDAAGQLVGYWISEQWGPADSYCFPFQIEAIYQYGQPQPVGTPILCRGAMQFSQKHQIEAQFDLLDPSGQVITRIEGWKDICYQVPRNNFYPCRISPQTEFLSIPWMQLETGTYCRLVEPFPEHFLETSWAIWQRMLAHLMLSPSERETWYGLPESGSRRTDWLLGRIAAKDAVRQWAQDVLGVALAPVDIEIQQTGTGQPVIDCPVLGDQPLPGISISHSQGYAVATLVSPLFSIGIDLEHRHRPLEASLLQAAFSEAEQHLWQMAPTEMQSLVLLGLWCAKEAAAKASGQGLQGSPQSWQIVEYTASFDHLCVAHADQSFQVRLWYTQNEVVALCLATPSKTR